MEREFLRSAVLGWLGANGLSLGLAIVVGGAVTLAVLSKPSPPAIEVRPREPQPTSVVRVYVHLDGAVAEPGVYALDAGARVFEAIEQAGGAESDADTGQLNLAARITDGQKLVIPRRPSSAETSDVAGATTSSTQGEAARPTAPETGAAATGPRINVNTATQPVLESLPGIGPVTARRVIEYRESNGPFRRIEQLRDARLVNASTFERIKNLITAT